MKNALFETCQNEQWSRASDRADDFWKRAQTSVGDVEGKPMGEHGDCNVGRAWDTVTVDAPKF